MAQELGYSWGAPSRCSARSGHVHVVGYMFENVHYLRCFLRGARDHARRKGRKLQASRWPAQSSISTRTRAGRTKAEAYACAENEDSRLLAKGREIYTSNSCRKSPRLRVPTTNSIWDTPISAFDEYLLDYFESGKSEHRFGILVKF
jgi:hypothetical protein